MIKRIKKNFLVIIVTIIILTLVDQLTKFLSFLYEVKTQGFIFLTISKNTGSAFSLFSNVSFYNTIVIIISIVFLIVSVYYYKKHLKEEEVLIFILILSGLLGNLIDRMYLGYVRDFVGIENFSIFNIADVYLTLAAILIIYDVLITESKFLNK